MTTTTPTAEEREQLAALLKKARIALITTVSADNQLVSRPMAVQERDFDGDLWFFTEDPSHKTDEVRANPEVNVAYFKDGTKEWVSVSGRARLTQDRKRVHELYKPDWKAWLEDQGGERNGGPDDPRIALIVVEPQTVTYMKSNQPRVVAMFKVMHAIATGEPPKVGSLRHVDGEELREAR